MRIQIRNILLGLAVLAAAKPGAATPVPAPKLTVLALFEEVIAGLHAPLTDQGWECVGSHALIEWSRGGNERSAALVRIRTERFHIPMAALTEKPVRLTTDAESQQFFQGVPNGIPRDGSMIGFKYAFYPNSVLGWDEAADTAEVPLVFFLVRTATPDLTKEDLEPPLDQKSEAERHQASYLRYEAYFAYKNLKSQDRPADALAMLQASAQGGYCQAQFALASHETDLGTPHSLRRAREGFRLAAGQDMREAQYAYGIMLGQGEGGPVDLTAARTHIERAAAQGHPRAQMRLQAWTDPSRPPVEEHPCPLCVIL